MAATVSRGAPTASFLFVTLLASTGCEPTHGPDTCTGGRNMTSPRIEAGLETTEDGPLVRIVWDPGTGRGADLPDAYFDAVLVEPTMPASSDFVASAELTATREITVVFSDLDAALTSSSRVGFTLWFPDRAAFIDCSHPGMPDRYLLNVVLTFDADGSISNSELSEDIRLGDV